MSKGRKRLTWEQLFKDYRDIKKRVKKTKKPDKYAGLKECFQNVRKCNCSGKLAYC